MNEIITVDLKENGRYLVVDELSKNEFIKYLIFKLFYKFILIFFLSILKALFRMET